MEKKLVKRMYRASAVLSGLYIKIAKELNIKPNVLLLLYAIFNEEPMSQRQISEEWFIPKTTLNTIVKECESLGLVKLDLIENAKREMNILLTDKGCNLAKSLFVDNNQFDALALSKTTKEFDVSFINAFEAYVNNYKSLLFEYLKDDIE